MRPLVAFTRDEAQAASEEWGFNCGPAAICAVTGLTPFEIRPSMGDFERKRYTNPSLMAEILARLQVGARQTYRADAPGVEVRPGPLSLVRVQWAGRWTNPGVPMRARYRHTHWVAVDGAEVFDINAICAGGWLPIAEWRDALVPWLLKECVPGNTGGHWMTHVLEVDGKDLRCSVDQ